MPLIRMPRIVSLRLAHVTKVSRLTNNCLMYNRQRRKLCRRHIIPVSLAFLISIQSYQRVSLKELFAGLSNRSYILYSLESLWCMFNVRTYFVNF